MASDLTTANYIFKRKYMGGQPADVALRAHPLLARIPKQDGFTGTAFYYMVRYANPQAVSGSFANAQTQSAASTSASSGVQFAMTRKTKHALVLLDGEAIAACGDEGSFLDLVTMETDGALEEMGDAYAFELYRDGSGNRGQRASASTNVITLTNADDARNFKKGMTVIASPNANGSSPRTGSTTVAAVDEDAGTVTLTSAAGITSFANSDYLFRQGDVGTALEGLGLCTPLTAPVFGSDSFRGVDRGADVRRLAGSRLSSAEALGNTIEENAGRTAIRIAQAGGKADELNLNPQRFWECVRRLNAKVEYEGGGGDATFGFESFKLATPAGTLTCFSDPDAPTTEGRITTMKAHLIKTRYQLPHVNKDDGNPVLRSSTSDALEARFRGFGNYMQKDTRPFGVFPIS